MSSAVKREEWPGSKPTGKKRTFRVTVSRTVELTVDETVIAQGLLVDNPIFRDPTADDVVQHLAFNLVGNGLNLSQIEGYANCPDSSATVPWVEWDVEVEREVKQPAKKKTK